MFYSNNPIEREREKEFPFSLGSIQPDEIYLVLFGANWGSGDAATWIDVLPGVELLALVNAGRCEGAFYRQNDLGEWRSLSVRGWPLVEELHEAGFSRLDATDIEAAFLRASKDGALMD